MKKVKEAFNNNKYALSLMWKICPQQVIHKGIIRLLGYFEWLFYSAFFMKYIIESMVSDKKFSSIVLFVIITMATFAGISLYNNYVSGVIQPVTQITVNNKLYALIFKKARNVELACFEDDSFYNKYMLALDKADERLIEMVEVIWGIILGAIATVIAFFLLYKIDKQAILFVVFPIMGNFVFNKVLAKIVFERNRDMAPYNRKMEYVNRVMYMSDYAKEVRLTGVFSLMKKHYHESVQGLINTTFKYTKKGMIFHWLQVIFTFSFIFEGLLIYGAYRTMVSHTLSLAELSVLSSIMVSSTWILITFTEFLMKGLKNGLFMWNLRSFLEYQEKIPENFDGDDVGDSISSIEFRNVSFSYKDEMVIKNLSFEIKSGKTYALVGYNGAGKSTIIKLLMRFYDPTEGEILCNGRNIKEYNLEKYRKLFATAFQDCKIFPMTVGENVLMNKMEDVDRECVKNALVMAGVYEKINSLTKGIDTILTKEFVDDGAVLSGGEYQKIGVARAFLSQSAVKIFDEPSSALDPISEYHLFDNIIKNSKGKTVLFISHRLSSVKNADWVFVLEGGKIKEQGTHQMLLDQQGLYAEMYTKQAENYLAMSPYEMKQGIFSCSNEVSI